MNVALDLNSHQLPKDNPQSKVSLVEIKSPSIKNKIAIPEELHNPEPEPAANSNSLPKPSPDIEAKDLIQLFISKILPEWKSKYKLSESTNKALEFTVKNFLDDHNTLRITCALGNEIAVALDESMRQWGFPKPLANALYYGLWGVALVTCGARAVLRGLGTQSWKVFTESSVQDAIAAIFGPTGIVLVANKVQDLFYKSTKALPQSLINFVKPIISVVAAELAIPRVLDPIGKAAGKAITNATFAKTA